jgi:Arc/MetJ-type ribon-helix-helix transcriptional regulator
MDATDTTSGQGERSDGRTDEQLDVNIGAKVPERVDKELRLLAAEKTRRTDRVTKSDVIRAALTEYLDRHRDEIADVDEQREGGRDE